MLNRPVRELATAAGVGTATAADRVARLRLEGVVHAADHGKKLTEPRRLLDEWLKGYETLVRPRLLIGRYRIPKADDPREVERAVEKGLGKKTPWGFGGGAAAHRLTGYYRGTDTIVHLQHADLDIVKALRALKAEDGPLVMLRVPGPVAFLGEAPHTVAPLLVYTELLFARELRHQRAHLCHLRGARFHPVRGRAIDEGSKRRLGSESTARLTMRASISGTNA